MLNGNKLVLEIFIRKGEDIEQAITKNLSLEKVPINYLDNLIIEADHQSTAAIRAIL